MKISSRQYVSIPHFLPSSLRSSSVAGVAPAFRLDFSAFSSSFRIPASSFISHGVLKNSNTLEEFKAEDKVQFLAANAEEAWRLIVDGGIFEETSRLNRFVVSTFADLKKYHYYYWFAFAAFAEPKDVREREPASSLDAVLSESQREALVDAVDCFADEHADNAFFVLRVRGAGEEAPLAVERLTPDFAATASSGGPDERCFLCFADPSSFESHPGWPLRNLLTLYAVHFASAMPEVDVICYRDVRKDGARSADTSLVLRLHVPPIVDTDGESEPRRSYMMQVLYFIIKGEVDGCSCFRTVLLVIFTSH